MSLLSSRYTRAVVSVLAATSFCTAAIAQRATLSSHIPTLAKQSSTSRLGLVAASKPLQVVISLPLRNQDALNTLLGDLYNPASASYHQWLQPADFDARFGPTADDYAALVAWARSNGLDIVAQSGNRRVLTVQASTSLFNRAFHVQLTSYHDGAHNRDFQAPDREPTLDLNIPVLAISGLDTSNPRVNHMMKKSLEKLSPFISLRAPVAKATFTGSGPGGSFTPGDMRAAYYGSGALTGSGQNVAIFSYDGYLSSDVSLWYSHTGVTASTIPITNVLTGGFDGGCELYSPCDDGEQVLDILQVQGMAPGLDHIYFYEGLSAVVELNQMVTDNTASVITSSWGGGDFGPGTQPAFIQMATQGQTFLNATGDDGAYNGFTYLPPSSEPYITQVGGTTLTTTGAGGAWTGETGWTYSGGGFFDPGILIPSWQQAAGVITATNAGSSVFRNAPDISAEADFDNTTVSNGAFQGGTALTDYGGTSFAAPRLAGYVALANQQSVANGTGRLGFINPSLYDLGLRTASTSYHDVISGSNPAYIPQNGATVSFSASAGYDLVTGWGSPNGAGLLNALTGPNFNLAMSASSITVARSSTVNLTLTVSPINNFSGIPAFAVANLPPGITSLVTSTGTNTYNLALTGDSTVVLATTTASVTATFGSIAHSGALIVNAVKRNGYDFTISATNTTAVQTFSGSSVVTVVNGGGYAGPVDLSISNLPTGVTAVFGTPSTFSTSNLTFYASFLTAPGTYTVLLTGTAAGSVLHTVPMILTIAGIPSVLPDGDFEATPIPWTFTSTYGYYGVCDRICGFFPHGGSNFALLNNIGASSTDVLAQKFLIPSGNSATLNLWLWIATAETTATAKNDTLTIAVVNAAGTSTTIATYSNLDASNGYTLRSYNLSAYMGQTVTLKFTGKENRSKATAFLLDDISVVKQ